MPATFAPFLEGRYRLNRTDADAYIRVRVSDGPHPDGSMQVYLPDGTALVVNGLHLLSLHVTSDCPDF